MIQTGAAAMLIEDQLSPKRCGHVAGKQVISMEEAVGKYRAAADVRDQLDRDFVLVARTDARGALEGGLEEAIRRANAYIEAGADVAFVEGIPSREELEYIVDSVHGPVLYNMIGISPMIALSDLKKIGVSIIGFGMAHWAATRSIWDYAHGLKKLGIKVQTEFLQNMKGHPLEDDHGFAGFPEMRRLEGKYLPGEETEKKYRRSLGYQP
jgi:2-methylisocitrate lyase-like PEP mutase family enzyme